VSYSKLAVRVEALSQFHFFTMIKRSTYYTGFEMLFLRLEARSSLPLIDSETAISFVDCSHGVNEQLLCNPVIFNVGEIAPQGEILCVKGGDFVIY